MARRKESAPIGQRAARREKVDVAFGPRVPEWFPNWLLIETAWDCVVPQAARSDLTDAVRTYLRDESLARAAPFKDDVVKKLATLHKAAEACAKAIAAFGRGAGAIEASARLRPRLPVDVDEQKRHLAKLARDADNLALAAKLALDELDGKPEPEPVPELDLNAVAARASALLPVGHVNDPVAMNAAIDQALAEGRAAASSSSRAEPDDDSIDHFFDVASEPAREWAAWERLMITVLATASRYGLDTTTHRKEFNEDGPENGIFTNAFKALAANFPSGYNRNHKNDDALAKALIQAKSRACH